MDRPIGVFDSGIGGLTVVKEIIARMPEENIIYFGDTARVPYGTKSKETIIKFSIENAHFLVKFNVKLIVVACNTASSFVVPVLEKQFKIPVVGVINPAADKAVKTTSTKNIGVIGTNATINSRSYEKRIKTYKQKIKIFSHSCSLFVPLIEEGWIDNKITKLVIAKYLNKFKKTDIDTLILGCTHYPLICEKIKDFLGEKIKLIDCAVETADFINKMKLVKNKKNGSKYKFFVSDQPDKFKKTGEKFLGRKINNVEKI